MSYGVVYFVPGVLFKNILSVLCIVYSAGLGENYVLQLSQKR